jgi:hypothetical protein
MGNIAVFLRINKGNIVKNDIVEEFYHFITNFKNNRVHGEINQPSSKRKLLQTS